MRDVGKVMVALGLLITVTGLFFWSGLGRGWFGRLPGDIHITRNSYSFHFPIVTCLLLSIVLTFLLWLFRR